jgi:hypothetical protein
MTHTDLAERNRKLDHALRVILLWAEADMENTDHDHELDPAHIAKVCRKALDLIKAKDQ